MIIFIHFLFGLLSIFAFSLFFFFSFELFIFKHFGLDCWPNRKNAVYHFSNHFYSDAIPLKTFSIRHLGFGYKSFLDFISVNDERRTNVCAFRMNKTAQHCYLCPSSVEYSKHYLIRHTADQTVLQCINWLWAICGMLWIFWMKCALRELFFSSSIEHIENLW